MQASQSVKADKAFIITMEQEEVIEESGLEILVVPAWKWILGNEGSLENFAKRDLPNFIWWVDLARRVGCPRSAWRHRGLRGWQAFKNVDVWQ